MKLTIVAFSLIFSLFAWAQATPPAGKTAPQAKSCCHHMAGPKGAPSGCCAKAGDQQTMQCCAKGKCEVADGKPCCEAKDMQAAMEQCKKQGCCKDGMCCAAGKACAHSASNAAGGCCGGNKCQRPQGATGGK